MHLVLTMSRQRATPRSTKASEKPLLSSQMKSSDQSSTSTTTMNKLNNLPQELVDPIFETLTPEDVIALRHTDRQLAKKTQERFNNAFNSLIVTCSKAGLERLEKFVNDPRYNYFVPKVKKVTIHSLTPYRLKELAESMSPQTEISDPYLQAYIYMRKTLIDSLNALPSLEVVTVTDLPFRGIVDPPALEPRYTI